MSKGKISGFYYQLIVITAISIFNHVMVIPNVLETAHRDAWVSVLFTGLPSILWVFLLYMINKRKSQKHIKLWLQQQIGKPFAYILITIIAVYILINVYFTQKELVIWTSLTFMPQTPTILLNMTFLIVCCYATLSGLKTLAIFNGLLLPLVMVLGMFVGIGNMPYKDYSLLFPILENGPTRILKGMLFPSVAMGQLVISLLITHKLKTKLSIRSMLLTSFVIFFLSLGPLTGVIAEFGPYEAGRLRFPASEEWSLLQFGRFIEHLDFLAIFQWLSGAAIRISFFLLIIIEMLNISNKKMRTILTISLFALIFVAAEYPISDLDFVNLIHNIFYPLSLASLILITIGLFIASLLTRTKLKGE